VAAQPFDCAKAWIRSARFGSATPPIGHTRAKLFSKTLQNILDSSRSRMCLASASIRQYRLISAKERSFLQSSGVTDGGKPFPYEITSTFWTEESRTKSRRNCRSATLAHNDKRRRKLADVFRLISFLDDLSALLPMKTSG